MLDNILKIISLLSNKGSFSKASEFYLYEISYSGDETVDCDKDNEGCVYETYTIKVKNKGTRDIEYVRLEHFDINKKIPPFFVSAGECYTFKIHLPLKWVGNHKSVYERFSFLLIYHLGRSDFTKTYQ